MTASNEVSDPEGPAQPEVNACIVWCSEEEDALVKYLEQNLFTSRRIIEVFGGAKLFLSANEANRRAMEQQLRSAFKSQKTNTIVLMLHDGCTILGTLGNFSGPAQLENASLNVRHLVPPVQIRKIFVDAKGKIREME